MALTDWTAQLSPDRIFSGDFSIIIPYLYMAVSIVVYAILIWHFYRFIARRNCFKISQCKHQKTVQFLKYFLLFPFVAILYFLGFSLMLFFLTKELDTMNVLTTAFAIIVAIRITAYYSEDLSRDVAKLLPLALLGIAIVTPSYFSFGDVLDKIYSVPSFLQIAIQLFFFIILTEWILRIFLNIRYKILPKKEQTLAEK